MPKIRTFESRIPGPHAVAKPHVIKYGCKGPRYSEKMVPELFEHLMKKENFFCTKIAMSNSPNSDLVTDFPQAGGQILSSQITTSSGRVVSKVMGGPRYHPSPSLWSRFSCGH
jgi:hypothetical protein